MPTFEFNQQLLPQSLVDIQELGQFALEGINEEGYFYYLVVRTSLGTVTLADCGPVVPDITLLPSGYQTSLERMPYKEDKVSRAINMWLNDRSKKLTEAKVIDIEEAIAQFRDLGEYLTNYSDEVY